MVNLDGGHHDHAVAFRGEDEIKRTYHKVSSTDEEVIITRNGSPVAVLISPEEFESLKETIAVRSDASLTDEIRKGLRALKAKKPLSIVWKNCPSKVL